MNDDKKHILFVCYGLGIGGIEKCLVNLLNIMPERYDIDVLLMNPQYAFKNQIKRNVRFLDTFDYVMNIEDTLNEINNRGGKLRNMRMFASYCVFRTRIKFKKNAWRGFKRLSKNYDIAIAYSHHDFSPYYVIDKVHAKKKILWYHNGAYEHDGYRYERDKKYYLAFDKVVAVSTDCAKILMEKFAFHKEQLIVLRNICDYVGIQKKANMVTFSPFEEGIYHIVTVGRMTVEKGALLAIDACKILCEAGLQVCWHWIGDGNQFYAVKERIKELELEQHFILEGNQDNPYPFIKCADVYVQPSYYEAYSTTITEAKVLKKPIVTTDVGGMRDQLVHEKNGLIVPIDAFAIADAIKSLLTDKNKRNKFSLELEKEKFCPERSLMEYEKNLFS